MKYILLISFCLIQFKSFGNQTDSLLMIEQIKSTKKLYRELRDYTKETQKLQEIYSKDLKSIQELSSNLTTDKNKINQEIKEVSIQLEELNKEAKSDSFKLWNFISSALSELIGAGVGVFFGLCLFFKESKRDKKLKKEEEKKELDEKTHYLGSLLKSTTNLTTKTIEGLQEYCDKMDADPITVPLLSINPKQDLERLGELISNEKYYYAFMKKYGSNLENVKKYRGIAGGVDYLNAQFNQLLEIQSNIQRFDYQRKMNYKSIFDKVRDESAEIGKRSQHTNPVLYNLIGDVLKNYYKNLDSFKLEYHEENFVQPLKEGLINNGFLETEEGRYISNQLKNATLIFTEIQEQNKNHSENFKEILKTLSTVLESLNKNGTELVKEFKDEKNTVANKASNGK